MRIGVRVREWIGGGDLGEWEASESLLQGTKEQD